MMDLPEAFSGLSRTQLGASGSSVWLQHNLRELLEAFDGRQRHRRGYIAVRFDLLERALVRVFANSVELDNPQFALETVGAESCAERLERLVDFDQTRAGREAKHRDPRVLPRRVLNGVREVEIHRDQATLLVATDLDELSVRR
jgi:hypothetical protein